MRSFQVPLALLFLALGVPSNAQKGAAGAESEVVVGEGAPLRIECQLRVEQRAEWRVNETAAPAADLRADTERAGGAGGVVAVLAAARARAHHAGVYRCARDPPSRAVRVAVLPPARAPAPAPAPDEAPSTAVPAAAESEPSEAGDLVWYQVGKLNAFQLNCTMPADQPADQFTYVWKVNDTEVTSVASLKDRYELAEGGARFRLKARAHEDDFGNYSCHVGGPAVRAWRVHGYPIAKLPANLNVVEGQKLKVTCRVIGKPYPGVEWEYRAEAAGNASDALAALAGRGETRASAAGVPRGELVIAAAQRGDAGLYRCVPAGARADDVAETTVRVKGMYDALWPFLGICAEVFLLCAIILVYEKRRTKPELDDSDTDNHDQKKS